MSVFPLYTASFETCTIVDLSQKLSRLHASRAAEFMPLRLVPPHIDE
jgi:hypothetical protein